MKVGKNSVITQLVLFLVPAFPSNAICGEIKNPHLVSQYIGDSTNCRNNMPVTPIAKLAIPVDTIMSEFILRTPESCDVNRREAVDNLAWNARAAYGAAQQEFFTKLNGYLIGKSGKLSSHESKTAKAVSGVAGLIGGGLIVPSDLAQAVVSAGAKAITGYNHEKRADNVYKLFDQDRLKRVSQTYALHLVSRLATPIELLKPEAAEQLAVDCAYLAYHYVTSGEVKEFLDQKARMLGRPLKEQELVQDIGKFLILKTIDDLPKLDMENKSIATKLKSITTSRPRYFSKSDPNHELKSSDILALASNDKLFEYPCVYVFQPITPQLHSEKSASQYFEEGKALLDASQKTGDSSHLEEAKKLLRAAAELGHTEGQFKLAHLLVTETGRADMSEPEKWFSKAAQAGHAKASFNLAAMNHNRNKLDEAKKHYLNAIVSNGNGSSMEPALLNRTYQSLGEIYEAEKDFGEAKNYFRKAAENGSNEAKVSLAHLLYEENNIQSLALAKKYYIDAARNNHAKAQFSLAYLLLQSADHGNQRTDNYSPYENPISLLEMAADSNHPDSSHGLPEAQFQLAVVYEKGKYGVRPDLEKAVKLYKQAVAQGNSQAKVRLEKLQLRAEK